MDMIKRLPFFFFSLLAVCCVLAVETSFQPTPRRETTAAEAKTAVFHTAAAEASSARTLAVKRTKKYLFTVVTAVSRNMFYSIRSICNQENAR